MVCNYIPYFIEPSSYLALSVIAIVDKWEEA
jgi:hypothetical protein